MKIPKKCGGGGGQFGGRVRVGGFRVDVNEKLKSFCEHSKKKIGGGGGSWGGQVGGSGWM